MRYFNLILTKHAEKMIKERGLTREIAWETFNHPDESKKDREGKPLLMKQFNGFKVTLVLLQNMKNEWIIKTIWRNPPLPGTTDEKKRHRWKEFKKTGFWGKILLTAKQQLGL